MPKVKKSTLADGLVIGNPASDIRQVVMTEQRLKDALGNRSVSEERDLQHLLDAAVSPDDWLAIFRNAKTQAMDGDKFSIMLLMKYKFGNPAPALPPKSQTNNRIAIVEVETTHNAPEELDDPI